MCDLQLVQGAKQGDRQSLDLLYKKFLPLIRKYANLSKDEDFAQEAYFTLIKAVDYVDFEKIPESYRDERWGFYGTMNQYLLNQVRSSINQSAKKQRNELSNPLLLSGELGLSGDAGRPGQTTRLGIHSEFPQEVLTQYSPERMVFSTDIEEKYMSFKRSLTNLESELLELRQQKKTLSEISKRWKMPLGKVKTMLINLKRRASHYFDVVYQYS